jgi:hypothetical protein
MFYSLSYPQKLWTKFAGIFSHIIFFLRCLLTLGERVSEVIALTAVLVTCHDSSDI